MRCGSWSELSRLVLSQLRAEPRGTLTGEKHEVTPGHALRDEIPTWKTEKQRLWSARGSE